MSDDDDARIRFEAHDGIEQSRLIIDHSALSDRGVYTCFGSNTVMSKHDIDAAQSESMVRVKDKLAALWPFLGICAEVFILCTIILIYEKRRNKTDLEERYGDEFQKKKSLEKIWNFQKSYHVCQKSSQNSLKSSTFSRKLRS